MTKPTTQRPPQVTFTAGLVMAGAAFVVLGNFSRVSTLRSLESLDAIRETLEMPPLSGMGLTLEQGIGALHAVLVVGAVSAVVCGIFGWFVLKGSQQARLVATIAAVPLFAAGMITGSFMSAMLAAAIAMLWMPPAREWIRDGSWTPPPPPQSLRRGPDAGPERPAGPADGRTLPPPRDTSSTPQGPAPQIGSSTSGRPGPWGQPFGQAPTGQGTPVPGARPNPYEAPTHAARAAGTRPPSLVLATLVTMLTSGAIALLCALLVVVSLADFEALLEPIRQQSPELLEQPGVSEDLLRQTTIGMGAALAVWAAVAFGLAVATLAGVGWARIALMVSSIACTLFCVVGVLAQPLAIVIVVASVGVLFLLRRADVVAWFAARR